MKKLLLLAFILISFSSIAQTFYGSTGSMPDFDSIAHPTYFTCVVSGLPNAIDSTFGLERACIDSLLHTYDGDLRIELVSPDNQQVELSFRRGTSGDNFIRTEFRGQGANGMISNGTPPFTGEYDPDGELSSINNGQNPNGTWYIIVTDMAAADTGSVYSWHLTFSNNPTPPIVMPCSTTNGFLCQCPDGSQDCDLIPDMTSSYQCILNDHYESGLQLFIGNATPNIGWGPLEIHGTNTCYCDTDIVSCTVTACPGSGLPPTQLVNQTIYHKHNSTITSYTRPAGTMTYHPSHGHIHLDNWAHYSLRRAVYGLQAPDWPIIGTGNKQSYCLVNLGDCTGNYGYCVDSTGSTITMADIPNAPMGSVTGCSTDQGIWTGKLDIYSSGLTGQWVDLPANICNGDYYVVSITDPLNVILETNDSNNWVAVPVTLTQQLNVPFPTCNFTYSANGYTLTLMNTSTDYDSVLWNFGDGNTSTGVNPIYTYSGPGDYTIVLTAYNQCGFTQQVVTVTFAPNGITETKTDVFGFDIAPNPTAGHSKITFTLAAKTNLSLDAFDMLGNKISTLTSGEHQAGTFMYLFDADQLNISKGVYTVRLTTDSKIISKRIVVLK